LDYPKIIHLGAATGRPPGCFFFVPGKIFYLSKKNHFFDLFIFLTFTQEFFLKKIKERKA